MRNVPARINREAFDRVLQRAAEIQAHGRDIGEGLTEAELVNWLVAEGDTIAPCWTQRSVAKPPMQGSTSRFRMNWSG